jgi:hypothetical protein
MIPGHRDERVAVSGRTGQDGARDRELQHPLVTPGAGYFLITAAGIAASFGIIAATFPLLRRIAGPGTAGNE